MMLTLKSCKAKVTIRYPHHKQAKVIYCAIKPDIVPLDKPKANSSFLLVKNELILETTSSDLPALRATLNSYLRLADASFRCTKI